MARKSRLHKNTIIFFKHPIRPLQKHSIPQPLEVVVGKNHIMPLTPNSAFRRELQRTDLYEGRELPAVVSVKGLESVGIGLERVAHGIEQPACLAPVDLDPALLRLRDFQSRNQRRRGAEVQDEDLRVEETEGRIACGEQIRQRLEQDGDIVKQLLREALRRVFDQMRQFMVVRRLELAFVEERLADAEVDVYDDGGYVWGEGREGYPCEGEVGPSVGEGDVQFVAKVSCGGEVTDGGLEFVVDLAAGAEETAVGELGELVLDVRFRDDHYGTALGLQGFEEDEVVDAVSDFQREGEEGDHVVVAAAAVEQQEDCFPFLGKGWRRTALDGARLAATGM